MFFFIVLEVQNVLKDFYNGNNILLFIKRYYFIPLFVNFFHANAQITRDLING